MMRTGILRAIRAFITFNLNPNSKKPTLFSKQGEIKIINYYKKFKLDLPYIREIAYNSISSKTKIYSILPKQNEL